MLPPNLFKKKKKYNQIIMLGCLKLYLFIFLSFGQVLSYSLKNSMAPLCMHINKCKQTHPKVPPSQILMESWQVQFPVKYVICHTHRLSWRDRPVFNTQWWLMRSQLLPQHWCEPDMGCGCATLHLVIPGIALNTEILHCCALTMLACAQRALWEKSHS